MENFEIHNFVSRTLPIPAKMLDFDHTFSMREQLSMTLNKITQKLFMQENSAQETSLDERSPSATIYEKVTFELHANNHTSSFTQLYDEKEKEETHNEIDLSVIKPEKVSKPKETKVKHIPSFFKLLLSKEEICVFTNIISFHYQTVNN